MVLGIENPQILVNGEVFDPSNSEMNPEDRYLAFELKDPIRPQMRGIRQNMFYNQNKSFVQQFEEVLPAERGGSWEPADEKDSWSMKKIPTILRYIPEAEYNDYPLEEMSYQVYSQNLGKHIKGEVICANGRPKTTDKVTIVVWPSYKTEPVRDEEGMLKISEKTGLPIQRMVRDENNNPIQEGYVKGWSPQEVGPRMASLYFPMSELHFNLEDGIHTMPIGTVEPDEPEEEPLEVTDDEEEQEQVQQRPRTIRR